MNSATSATHAVNHSHFVDGMFNGVWVTGYVRNIDRQNGVFYLQQTNNLNHMLPVHFDLNNQLPDSVRDTDPLHVIGNVEGYFNKEKNERGAYLKAIAFEKPSKNIQAPDLAFNQTLATDIPTDDFKPTNGASGLLNASSNVVRIAGVVQAAFLTQKANPALVILLRQKSNADLAIPVRLYGAFARPLKNRIKIGDAIYIEGQYRVNVKERPDLRTADHQYMPVDKVPYVHTANARIALPEEIISIPEWALQNGWLSKFSQDEIRVDESVLNALCNERINPLTEEEARNGLKRLG